MSTTSPESFTNHLPVKEAAAYLGISQTMFRRLAKDHRLQRYIFNDSVAGRPKLYYAVPQIDELKQARLAARMKLSPQQQGEFSAAREEVVQSLTLAQEISQLARKRLHSARLELKALERDIQNHKNQFATLSNQIETIENRFQRFNNLLA